MIAVLRSLGVLPELSAELEHLNDAATRPTWHPAYVDWSKVPNRPRSFRWLEPEHDRLSKATRKDLELHRKVKRMRAARAARMNPAWKGQSWVEKRFPKEDER